MHAHTYKHTHTLTYMYTHTCEYICTTHTCTHTHTHTLLRSATDPFPFLCKEALGFLPQPQLESGVVQQLRHGLAPHHHRMLRALTVRKHLDALLQRGREALISRSSVHSVPLTRSLPPSVASTGTVTR